jgi:hypothetical protein
LKTLIQGRGMVQGRKLFKRREGYKETKDIGLEGRICYRIRGNGTREGYKERKWHQGRAEGNDTRGGNGIRVVNGTREGNDMIGGHALRGRNSAGKDYAIYCIGWLEEVQK